MTMATASPRPSIRPAAPSWQAPSRRSPASEGEGWIKPFQWLALVVFLSIPVVALLVPAHAGRLVWTVAVASLPLFIVLVGYHRWRRICPLAGFAQLAARLGYPGTQRAGPWLEANAYYVAFAIFFVSLWLRLIATNGDGQAIAVFFALLSLAAVMFGMVYTGKTWCHYLCPVSFIEKIYTEPHGLRETPNSQCRTCTACKKACPDINEEHGYWKEMGARPKRVVYFAYPGLVFGFYVYYYLQAGTWQYYFSGAWTHQPRLIAAAFLPGYDAETAGFAALPGVPRACAAALTLALCSLASVVVFSQLEGLMGSWLRQRHPTMEEARARHVLFTLAAFIAFVTFYSFAGAPTLRLVPPIQHLFLILMVLTATLVLVRRLRRTQHAFAEEALARNMIKHWAWTDIHPPQDLHEAFLIHTIRARESKKGAAHILDVYKQAVRDTLANGLVTRAQVYLLASLRNQLQIKTADHDTIMAELAEEERDVLSDPTTQVSIEKRLQLDTYAHALRSYLEEVFAADGTADARFITQLRTASQVTPEEHAAVLDAVLGGAGSMEARLAEELRAVEHASQIMAALAGEPSPAHAFLSDLWRHRRERAIGRLLQGLTVGLGQEMIGLLREGFCAPDRARREATVERLCASVAPAIAERLRTACRESASPAARLTPLTDLLRASTESVDPYVRATALYVLGTRGAIEATMVDRLSQDEHGVVRETALQVRQRAAHGERESDRRSPLTTLEKMIALRAAPIFAHLAPESLAAVAWASVEEAYPPGQALCVEGESGHEVFILLEGEVAILHRSGGGERLIGMERAGGLIGELAVLDPAPRSATVRAGPTGVRILLLEGQAFREALNTHPAMAAAVIRTLAQRLRERPHDPAAS